MIEVQEDLESYPYFCESGAPRHLIKHPRPLKETLLRLKIFIEDYYQCCLYCSAYHGSSVVFTSTMEMYLSHVEWNHPGLTAFPAKEDLDEIKSGYYEKKLRKR